MDSGNHITLRRLRQNRWIRELVKEHRVSIEQLVQPLFVVDGIKERESVPGLTGNFRETSESLLKTIESDIEKGVRKFMLFGVPKEKSTRNFRHDFAVRVIERIRRQFGNEIFLFADICLCSSTVHGHCGVLSDNGDHIDNCTSVDELARMGLEYAQAGADGLAPSDMIDGRVGAIRKRLDESGLNQTVILSHASKFSSKFYGPFRTATDCAPKSTTLKDRATYQVDGSSPRTAYLSSLRDAEEGADILMVKPGLPYLDILAKLSAEIPLPWAVYEVSGEFAAIEVLAQQGLIQGPAAHLECWTSFCRAGASTIVTYGARFAQEYFARCGL